MTAKLIALIVPLGLDTFAIAAAIGVRESTRAARVRLSLLFMAFEGGMPLVGLALGGPLARSLGSAADLVAIAMLLAVGLLTLFSSDEGEERVVAQLTNARGAGLLLLGLSVSSDELAIGFTLGLLRVPVPLVIALIAVQTLIVTQVGLRLGSRVGATWREGAEQLAGVALTVLAVVLLAERLLP